jgi:aerobic-type carbon monoxide dehydrogenase small subunit (CoxS/CutS family)
MKRGANKENVILDSEGEQDEEVTITKKFLMVELTNIDCPYCKPTRIYKSYFSLKNHISKKHRDVAK